MTSIVDTVVLCGRTGCALRGHRDDSQYYPPIGEYSKVGVGNFIEFLNFAVRRGDSSLKKHLTSSPKNATYISKNSQNEIISCFGKVITSEIISSIKAAKFFTIIADECSDSSGKEQLSYVDSNFDVKEDFIRFLHCNEGLSGQGLFTVLSKCLENDLQLDIMNCRGQAYDGAGAVAGKNKGLSTLVRNVNSKALYTHCFNHQLNLAVQKGCTIPPIRDMLAEVKEMCYFFKFSQSRLIFLDESITKFCGKSDVQKRLKDVCRTRWVERIKGLSQFEELYVSIVNCLETMSVNADKKLSNENAGKAGNRLRAVINFEFIVSLVITRCVFDLTLPVTQLLQAKSIDIYNGLDLITALKNTLWYHLNCLELKHDEWYSIAQKLAESVNVEEKMPRYGKIKIKSTTPSEYFRRTILIKAQ